MFRLHERCPSLSDLVDLRASLRRQDLLLRGALSDVQGELRCWEQHRREQANENREVPRELCMLWDELRERERELALDLLQVQAALREANREVSQRLRPAERRVTVADVLRNRRARLGDEYPPIAS